MSKKPATGEKPECYNPPVSIPLSFGDAVGGLLKVDPKKLPHKQAKAEQPVKPTKKAAPKKKR